MPVPNRAYRRPGPLKREPHANQHVSAYLDTDFRLIRLARGRRTRFAWAPSPAAYRLRLKLWLTTMCRSGWISLAHKARIYSRPAHTGPRSYTSKLDSSLADHVLKVSHDIRRASTPLVKPQVFQLCHFITAFPGKRRSLTRYRTHQERLRGFGLTTALATVARLRVIPFSTASFSAVQGICRRQHGMLSPRA